MQNWARVYTGNGFRTGLGNYTGGVSGAAMAAAVEISKGSRQAFEERSNYTPSVHFIIKFLCLDPAIYYPYNYS
jgi:hypothetical protein